MKQTLTLNLLESIFFKQLCIETIYCNTSISLKVEAIEHLAMYLVF